MSYYYRRRNYRRRNDGAETLAYLYIFWPVWVMPFVFPHLFFFIIPFLLLLNIFNSKNSSKNKKPVKRYSQSSKKYSQYKYKKTGYSDSPRRSKGENKLYEILKSNFPNETVERNARPNWLEKLELDIYFPEKNLAYEYQGEQHRYPVSIFGGQEGLARQKRNDSKKRALCKLKGVTLVEIWYDEPLTSSFVMNKTKQLGFPKEIIINDSIQTNQGLKLNNVVQLNKKKISNEGFVHDSINQKAATNLTNKNGSLPCLTCGFSVCREEYHFGA